MENNNSSYIKVIWEKQGNDYKRELTVKTHVLGLIAIIIILAVLALAY